MRLFQFVTIIIFVKESPTHYVLGVLAYTYIYIYVEVRMYFFYLALGFIFFFFKDYGNGKRKRSNGRTQGQWQTTEIKQNAVLGLCAWVNLMHLTVSHVLSRSTK